MAPCGPEASRDNGAGREGKPPTAQPRPNPGRLWSVAHTSEFVLPPGKRAGTSALSLVT